MTMANIAVSSSPIRPGVSLRKTNKPLMEKRRRARINDSLSQLKSLVIQGSKKDSSQFNKLEKADILELTVKHLRHLQDQQHHQLNQHNGDASLAGKYQAGFLECANEVIRYLGQSQGFTDDVKSRVVHHLASCIQLSSKISIAKSTSNQSAHNVPTHSSIAPAGLHITSNQVSNGQPIKVVNNQLHKITSSNIASFQQVPVSSAMLPSSTVHTHNPVSTTPVTTSTTPLSQLPGYIKYTQPLLIEIPPVLSPTHLQSKAAQHQKPNNVQELHKIPETSSHLIPPHMATPKKETTTFSSSLPPKSQEQPLPVLPLRTFQKPQKYYSYDDQYQDFLPRPRAYSLTSSSSESEMSSPLNLSQSPNFYDHKEIATKYEHRDSNMYDHRGITNTTSNYRDVGQNTYSLAESTTKYPSPISIHYTLSPTHSDISSAHPTSKEGLLISQCPSSYASVIVDGRKPSDGHALNYLHFMDEERRHFIRHEGSTSPASSVGEERLWRPW